MVFAGERYYNIYRTLLMILGLWPDQKPLIFHTAFCFCSFTSLIFFQLTRFLTQTCNLELIIEELSNVLPIVVYLSMYNAFYFNAEVMKQLWEQIKIDWDTLQKDSEIKTLQKYAVENYFLTLILIGLLSLCLVSFIIIEFTPIILDIVAPLANVTRPRKVKVEFEMFLDEEEYFYVYLIHEIVVIIVALITLVSTGTTLLALMRHSCATYKIASDLLENVVTEVTLRIPVHRRVCVMHQEISRAVHIHRKSMQFCEFLVNNVNRWFFIIMGVGVLSLSCNLLRLLNATMLFEEIDELLYCFGVVAIHFVVMFLANFMGQSITDHSTELFYATYRSLWYRAPLPIQKLLLFVMQYTIKTNTIMIGGFFIASLEGFSSLATTSISYFTVIYSVN